MKSKNDDHYVYFRGVRLSKRDARRVGIAIIFGVIGLIISIFISEVRVIRFIIIALLSGIGFFVVGSIYDKDK